MAAERGDESVHTIRSQEQVWSASPAIPLCLCPTFWEHSGIDECAAFLQRSGDCALDLVDLDPPECPRMLENPLAACRRGKTTSLRPKRVAEGTVHYRASRDDGRASIWATPPAGGGRRLLRAGAVTKSPQVSSRYPQITEVSLDVVELPQVDEGGARLRNRNLARRGATGYAHSAGPAPQPEPPRSWSAWVLRSVLLL